MRILLPITFLQLQFFTRELAPSQNWKQKWKTICQTFDEDLLNISFFLKLYFHGVIFRIV